MGIHYFYTWLTYRYPLIRREFTPRAAPVIDYLYLDLNGIIHRCAKDDSALFKDLLCGKRTEEIYVAILNYTNYIISLIKPRKGIMIAVDGVAPRAKMNNQRNRRFMAAKSQSSVNEFMLNTLQISPNIVYFKNNSISPGTEFMIQLNKTILFFIKRKLLEDLDWRGLEVIFSGGDVPGEGEHKILNYIRQSRQQPNFDNEATHCIYGNDSDLVLLSLITHLPHVMLLREEFQPIKHTVINSATKRSHETGRMEVIFVNLLREYFQKEFSEVLAPKQSDLERIIDDFVLFSFFIGNDFLHQVYCMNTKLGIFDEFIEIMVRFYKKEKRFLTNKSVIDWEAFFLVLGEFLPLQKKMIKTTIADFNSRLAELHKNSFYAQFKKRPEGDLESELPVKRGSPFAENIYDPLLERERERERQSEQDREAYRLKREAEEKAKQTAAKNDIDLIAGLMTQLNIKSTDNIIEQKDAIRNDQIPPVIDTIHGLVAEPVDAKIEAKERPEHVDEEVEDPAQEPLYQRETTIREINEEEIISPEEEGVSEDEEAIAVLNEEQSKQYLAEFKRQYDKLVRARDLMQEVYSLIANDGNYQEVYYRDYFGIKSDFPGEIARICYDYLNGVDFVYKYYYCGCPSWDWYYKYHLSPLLFDLYDYLKRMRDNGQSIEFSYGPSRPTEPYIQLLYILPKQSLNLLPDTLIRKVVAPESPIQRYYPTDFEIAPFDKHKDYTWLALIEHIDDRRMSDFFANFDMNLLTSEEKFRNSRGHNFRFVFDANSKLEVQPAVGGFETAIAPISVTTIEIDSEFASLPNFIDYEANHRPRVNSQKFPTMLFSKKVDLQKSERKGRYKFDLFITYEALEDMFRDFIETNKTVDFFSPKSTKIVYYDPIFQGPLVVKNCFMEKTSNNSESTRKVISDTVEFLSERGIRIAPQAINSFLKRHNEIPIFDVATPSYAAVEYQGLHAQKAVVTVKSEHDCRVAFFGLSFNRCYPRIKELPNGALKNIYNEGDICFDTITGDLVRLTEVRANKEIPEIVRWETITVNPTIRRIPDGGPSERLFLIDERLLNDLGLELNELKILWLILDSIKIYCDHSSHTTMVLGDGFEVGLNFINFLNRRPEEWRLVSDMVRTQYKFKHNSANGPIRKNSFSHNDCMFVWQGDGGRLTKYYNVYLTGAGLTAVREYITENAIIVSYLRSVSKSIFFYDKKARVLRYKTQFNAGQVLAGREEAQTQDLNIILFKLYAGIMKKWHSNLFILPALSMASSMTVVNESLARARFGKRPQRDTRIDPVFLIKYSPYEEIIWPPFNQAPYYHELGDRVAFINSQHAYIKFGSLATVIGVYKEQIEVLFDEPFVGATSLNGRCPPFRGKVTFFFDLFNISKWTNIIVDYAEPVKVKKALWNGNFDLNGLLKVIADNQRRQWPSN